MASIDRINSRTTSLLCPHEVRGHNLDVRIASERRLLVLDLGTLAAVIMTASGTDMVRPLKLSAIGAFTVGLWLQRVVRTPHIALGR